jgi:hypothetical protein
MKVFCRHSDKSNGPGAVMTYQMFENAASTVKVKRYTCPECLHVIEITRWRGN